MIYGSTNDGCKLTLCSDVAIGAFTVLCVLDVDARLNAIKALSDNVIKGILYDCHAVKITISDDDRETLSTFVGFISETLGW